MSKRKKNAGEGYGYMFSGAFAKKADAVKKEKTRKGSFVKSVMTRQGHRYVVMTPRTNPRKTNPRPRGFDKLQRELEKLERTMAAGNLSQAAYNRLATRREQLKARMREHNPSELLVMGDHGPAGHDDHDPHQPDQPAGTFQRSPGSRRRARAAHRLESVSKTSCAHGTQGERIRRRAPDA
jgi:hypothetical protein